MNTTEALKINIRYRLAYMTKVRIHFSFTVLKTVAETRGDMLEHT
jgi:hypothetical protein